MQLETKPTEPLSQRSPQLLRIVLMFKTHHEVVSKTHDDDSTARMTLTPLVDPEIEDVVQKNVRKQRADPCSLRSTLRRFLPLSCLENTGSQPSPDDSEDALVGDSMNEHSEQPLVVDRVEKAPDVGIEYPVHVARHDAGVKRVEGVVRASSRTKSV